MIFATNKTDVSLSDHFWNLDMLDLKDYGPENIKGYRYVLFEKFSILCWTIPLKNENAQTIEDSLEIF